MKAVPHPHVDRLSRTTSRKNKAAMACGLALTAAALAVRLKTRQAERAHMPQGSFIIIDGIRLHYIDRGQGQPVVLLHGNGMTMDDFTLSGVVDLAAKSYRVIVFDRPGYGHSDRPGRRNWSPQAQAALLTRALKMLKIEQPVVVGHSWGATVALAMALDEPRYVRSLVLLSGYYYPSLRPEVPFMAAPAIPIAGALLRHTIAPLIGRMMWPAMLKKLFAPATVPASYKRFPAWLALRPTHLHATAEERAMMIPAAYTLHGRYHELTLPVVVMCGEADTVVDIDKQSARLHAELPRSDMHRIPGDGHMIHHLVPYEVMNAIDTVAKPA